MNKSALLLSVLLVGCVFALTQARTFPSYDSPNEGKRFLGSIGSWINNNVINPISGGITTVIDTISGGVNTVINTISDPFAGFLGSLQNVAGQVSNTLTDAVNSAINTIKDQSLTLINMASAIIFPNGAAQAPTQDPCATTCFQRINYNDQVTDYYFDRPNGCISKGFIDKSVAVFDECCDKHNTCLNSKCCTTDCQNLKNQCDTEYDTCLKSKCVPYIADNVQFYSCLGRGAFMASIAVNRTCSTTLTVNRKICYC